MDRAEAAGQALDHDLPYEGSALVEHAGAPANGEFRRSAGRRGALAKRRAAFDRRGLLCRPRARRAIVGVLELHPPPARTQRRVLRLTSPASTNRLAKRGPLVHAGEQTKRRRRSASSCTSSLAKLGGRGTLAVPMYGRRRSA